MKLANGSDRPYTLGNSRSRRHRGIRASSLQCNVLQPFPSKALATDVEDQRVVKNPVKQAQQGIGLLEVLLPLGRCLVAREHEIECAFLVVPAVDHIEEQARVFLVEFAVPNFINDQAGRTDERGQCACLLPKPSGIRELVAKLRRFYEVGFHPVLAALVAESHGQVCLSRPCGADEREIPVGVNGSQGREAFQPFYVFPFQYAEIEILEGLRVLERQPAGPHEHLDRRLLFLGADVLKHFVDNGNGLHGIGVVGCELGKFG